MTNNHQVGDKIQLTIDRLSYNGGRGVGRHDNFVFFVPDTGPAETVIAKITALKKNYGEADLVEIIQASPHRRATPCPIVNECGGCTWQHISYAEQVEQKREFIKHQLKNFLPESLGSIEITPAPSEFRYRNRVQIHAENIENKKLHYGFLKKGTKQIVPTTDCLIAEELLFKDLIGPLQKIIAAQKLDKHKIELALKSDGSRVIRHLAKDESEFSQVNSAQNVNLKSYVVQLLQSYKDKTNFKNIFDLYCGSGNLTEPIASAFSTIDVLGVEQNSTAIERANKTRPSNVKYKSQDVLSFLTAYKADSSLAMVLDPARAGLGSLTCSQILRIKPKLIVYISCSLPSLSRDLDYLTKGGYKLDALHGFDMFPQTEYIESVAVLLPRAIQGFC